MAKGPKKLSGVKVGDLKKKSDILLYLKSDFLAFFLTYPPTPVLASKKLEPEKSLIEHTELHLECVFNSERKTYVLIYI